MLADQRIFETATLVGDERQLASPMGPALSHDHLICIGVHHQVGVVGHDDDLPPLLRVPKTVNQFLIFSIVFPS